MSKKRYRPEEIIAKLREADVLINWRSRVADLIKALGITDVQTRGQDFSESSPLSASCGAEI